MGASNKTEKAEIDADQSKIRQQYVDLESAINKLAQLG
jgi:hypothetical protein